MVDTTVIAGLLVAVAAPLGSYFVAAKKLSGRIDSSDATELWAESRSMREWMTERNKEMGDQIRGMESRMSACEQKCHELTVDFRKAKRERDAALAKLADLGQGR